MPPVFRSLAAVLAVTAALGPSLAAAADAEIDLSPDRSAWARPVRVTASLRVVGRVTPEAPAGQAAVPHAVDATLHLAFRQEGLQAGPDGTPRVARVAEPSASLRADRRTLLAESTPDGATVAAASGPLTRAELDAVQLPADVLDIDSLLPDLPTRESGSWRVDPDGLRRVLRLESSSVCEVTAIVSEATEAFAKVRFAGPVEGLSEGAEVSIDLRGVALFDRAEGRLVRLNLGWREARKVGPATPALEATAKLNVSIEPAERLAATDLLLAAAASPDRRLEVSTGDRAWRLLAERDWYTVAADRHATTLRRVTAGKVGAVVTLVAAPRRAISLDQLDREVRYTLGDKLRQVVASEESVSDTGLPRKLVASIGSDGGRPVEWRHFHVEGPLGALSAAATLPIAEQTPDDSAVRRLVDSASPSPAETAAAAPASRR